MHADKIFQDENCGDRQCVGPLEHPARAVDIDRVCDCMGARDKHVWLSRLSEQGLVRALYAWMVDVQLYTRQ